MRLRVYPLGDAFARAPEPLRRPATCAGGAPDLGPAAALPVAGFAYPGLRIRWLARDFLAAAVPGDPRLAGATGRSKGRFGRAEDPLDAASLLRTDRHQLAGLCRRDPGG